jgi:hypothetical protein
MIATLTHWRTIANRWLIVNRLAFIFDTIFNSFEDERTSISNVKEKERVKFCALR